MNREEARQEIRARAKNILQPDGSGKGFVCPVCGSGSGQKGTGITTKDGIHFSCWGRGNCFKSADIIEIIGIRDGISDYNEQLKRAAAETGVDIDTERHNAATQKPRRTISEASKANTYTTQGNAAEAAKSGITDAEAVEYMEMCADRLPSSEAAKNYIFRRGISLDTARACGIGFDSEYRSPGSSTAFTSARIIIPTGGAAWTARAISDTAKTRYLNHGAAAVFNADRLYNSDVCFITEGAFDAMSIEECGGRAAALNSTSNAELLLKMLEKRRTDAAIVVCMDDDEAGRNAAQILFTGLEKLKIRYTAADIYSGSKDANEALTADRSRFISAVGKAIVTASELPKPSQTAESSEENRMPGLDPRRPDSVSFYMGTRMLDDLNRIKRQKQRKTGFQNLDAEMGSLYSGLYVIGGISSVGKTTFVHQIADNMARAGDHVLYFSMEQSSLEMITKSLARVSFTGKNGADHARSAIQMRTVDMNDKETWDIMAHSIAEYAEAVGDRISIIEGNFNSTASFIEEYTRNYAKNNGVLPVVIVDYLQVLQPSIDVETGRKMSDLRQITDANVTRLKRLSRDLDIPVIVLSSLNRGNYLAPIDFEAFKESGGIEYTADVVLGLQLSVVNAPAFRKDGKDESKAEKRAALAEAKEAIPRDVEIVCLKNRYGKSRYKAAFTYYPQYDTFVPARLRSIL